VSDSGPDSFGFEIEVPPPDDELSVWSMAHLVYRTLRRSGLRWAMWNQSRAVNRASRSERRQMVPGSSPTRAHRSASGESVATGEAIRDFGWLALGGVSIALLALALVVSETLGAAFAAIGLAGLVVLRLTATWPAWTAPPMTPVHARAPRAARSRRETVRPVTPWKSRAASVGEGGPDATMA
jgi:hypothetical protein